MNTNVAPIQPTSKTPIATLAARLHIDAAEAQSLMMNTLMKAKDGKGQVTDAELITFLAICNEYRLNPLTKEIYAFNNRGAIQPIVSIDGWLKIINEHPQFDGMEFVDLTSDAGLSSVTCRIYRKDRTRPTEVTEYMAECKGTSEPWRKWPARMLRHKATIQAARYAFGLSGIIDEDEAERYKQTNLGEREINPRPRSSSISAKLAPKATAQPDFDINDTDVADMPPTPVDELLKHLPHCNDKQDLGEWKTSAMAWPEDSPEYSQLVSAYSTHCTNLKRAAEHQEG